MKKLSTLLLLAMGVVVLTGCMGPVGKWKLVDVVPPEADGGFQIKHVQFTSKGAYVLKADRGDGMEEWNGTYEYDRDTNQMTLTGETGKTRIYRVEFCGPCGYMYMYNPGERKEWKATFKRQ